MSLKKIIKNTTKITLASALLTLTTPSFATTDLVVWEDNGKSEFLKEAADDFEKNHDVKVVFKEMFYIYALEKLRLDGPLGNGPDLLLLPNDQIGSAVEEGMLEPIHFSQKEQDEFIPTAIEAVRYNGNTYGVPKTLENLALFYNKDKIKKPFTDLEDYFAYAEKVKEEHPNNLGFVMKLDDLYYAYPIVHAYGGYCYGRNQYGEYKSEDYGLDNEGAITAYKYLRSAYQRNFVPQMVKGSSQTMLNVLDYFLQGRVDAMVSGTWSVEKVKKAKINFGIAPLPFLPNNKHMSGFNGIRSYAISKWSKNYETALEFAKFLGSYRYSKQRYLASGEIPVVKAVIDDPAFKNDKLLQAFVEQSKYNEAMPNIRQMSDVWPTAAKTLKQMFEGNENYPIEEGIENPHYKGGRKIFND